MLPKLPVPHYYYEIILQHQLRLRRQEQLQSLLHQQLEQQNLPQPLSLQQWFHRFVS